MNLFALILVGIARIVLTYGVFFQTADEPAHVGSGMAWLDEGDVSDPDHPPLARVASAIGLYAAGVRLPSAAAPVSDAAESPRYEQGNALLASGGRYIRNLTLARIGTIPFFVFACVVVRAWARRLFGGRASVGAVFLFTGLPPVLGHSGLATTDMAAAATLCAALYAFVLWLERPDGRRGLALGLALGLAGLAKFSNYAFLPAVMALVLLLRAWGTRGSAGTAATPRHRLRSAALAGLVAFFVVWAGYRFSVGPLVHLEGRPHPGVTIPLGVDGFLERHPRIRDAAFVAMEVPLPAREAVHGLLRLGSYNERGRLAYFLGEYRSDGWWYFFPVVLIFKTPIAFLLLVIAGCLEMSLARARPTWERWTPLLAAALLLALCLPARLNLGLRHILAVYPLLSVVGGFGLSSLFGTGLRWEARRFVAAALSLWFLAAGVLAHPDYMADFNELARGRPEQVVLDSDLDWGQDLWRLRDRLAEVGAEEVALGYYWTGHTQGQGLPRVRALVPFEPTTGWVAISEYTLKTHGERLRRQAGKQVGAFAWLEGLPYERVGTSIRLYSVTAK
jgi:4-amino-4-deoxy-L-arabinose transferase-like glycosyltransferase